MITLAPVERTTVTLARPVAGDSFEVLIELRLRLSVSSTSDAVWEPAWDLDFDSMLTVGARS